MDIETEKKRKGLLSGVKDEIEDIWESVKKTKVAVRKLGGVVGCLRMGHLWSSCCVSVSKNSLGRVFTRYDVTRCCSRCGETDEYRSVSGRRMRALVRES